MSTSNSRYPWKTFAILTAAGTLTGPLVLPYYFGLRAIVPHPEPLPAMPLAMLVLLAMGRGLVFCAPAAALGLLLARQIELGAPWLEHWADGAVRPASNSSVSGPTGPDARRSCGSRTSRPQASSDGSTSRTSRCSPIRYRRSSDSARSSSSFRSGSRSGGSTCGGDSRPRSSRTSSSTWSCTSCGRSWSREAERSGVAGSSDATRRRRSCRAAHFPKRSLASKLRPRLKCNEVSRRASGSRFSTASGSAVSAGVR